MAIFSICVTSTANAGLIVGDLYADDNGIQWQYVGNFDLADGDGFFVGATPYNGIDAAILNFGALSAGESYALSSNKMADYSDINNFIVNYQAWYDAFDFRIGIHEAGESVQANNAGGVNYDQVGDISAYILDRAFLGDNINHVFKSVAVPEPSSLAIFAIALIGLSIGRFKKQ